MFEHPKSTHFNRFPNKSVHKKCRKVKKTAPGHQNLRGLYIWVLPNASSPVKIVNVKTCKLYTMIFKGRALNVMQSQVAQSII